MRAAPAGVTKCNYFNLETDPPMNKNQYQKKISRLCGKLVKLTDLLGQESTIIDLVCTNPECSENHHRITVEITDKNREKPLDYYRSLN